MSISWFPCLVHELSILNKVWSWASGSLCLSDHMLHFLCFYPSFMNLNVSGSLCLLFNICFYLDERFVYSLCSWMHNCALMHWFLSLYGLMLFMSIYYGSKAESLGNGGHSWVLWILMSSCCWSFLWYVDRQFNWDSCLSSTQCR